jgi:hypothetical protein
MLLRRRTSRISTRPIDPSKGFEHLDQEALALLRWLKDNQVEFVLVGATAEAVRGRLDATGPVTIVPAPYRRNLARLDDALSDAGAGVRVDGGGTRGDTDTTPIKFTAEKLGDAQRWALRCGMHDIDIERSGRPGQKAAVRAPVYQELLYEAGRFEPIPGLSVEVAAPEDIEHFAHLRKTGRAPEMRISRQAKVGEEPGKDSAQEHDATEHHDSAQEHDATQEQDAG